MFLNILNENEDKFDFGDTDFKDFKKKSSSTKDDSMGLDDGLTETTEGDMLVAEAIIYDMMLDEGIDFTETDLNELYSEGLLLERSIVRLDRQAKKNLKTAKAAIIIAKERNSKFYKVFKKACIAKRWALANIMKLFEPQAKARAARVSSTPKFNSIIKKKKGNTMKKGSVKTNDIKETKNSLTINKMGGVNMRGMRIPKNANETKRWRFNRDNTK